MGIKKHLGRERRIPRLGIWPDKLDSFGSNTDFARLSDHG